MTDPVAFGCVVRQYIMVGVHGKEHDRLLAVEQREKGDQGPTIPLRV